MAVHLLDTNVLLALFDPWHVHHEAAHRWFERNRASGWATCPIVENGFVRISSMQEYPNSPGNASEVAGRLMAFCDDPAHTFWPDDVRISDIINAGSVLIHGQITDVYLLGLAVHNRGKLATFDRRIAAALVRGGPAALSVIPV